MTYRSHSSFTLLTAWLLATSLHAGDGVLDLTRQVNYSAQAIPDYIQRDNTPGGANPNPITNMGATLGRVLFYDKRLSRNNTISCASCHQQAFAFSDPDVASTGVAGTTGRHSMRLVNSRFSSERRFFWDERANNLEAQTSEPIRDHIEMGFSGTNGDPDFADLITKLNAIEEYRVLFTAAFGSATINQNRIQRALAQFIRSIQSFDSKYDIGRSQVANNGDPFPNFTTQENNGKNLFATPPNQGGAGCATCHRPPEFDIDPNSLNNGVVTVIGGGTDLTNTRSPSLRDLTRGSDQQLNGPYMHDGSLATLAAVINHYIAPPNNADLDPRLQRPPLNLNTQQRNDLVAFLRTLAGNAVYTDPKWSDPFNAQNQLSLIVISIADSLIHRAPGSSVTLSSKGAPGLTYRLESTTQPGTNWTLVTTVTADAAGTLQHTLTTTSTPTFYRFTYTPPAP